MGGRRTSRKARGLPEELKALVRDAGIMLGEVIREAGGSHLFSSVERVRLMMSAFREGRPAEKARRLREVDAVLRRLPFKDRIAFAKAYTLYLQLINVCENAYRTARLRRRAELHGRRGADLIYVITAHPTESRSPENIALFDDVQRLLVEALAEGRPPDLPRLKHVLRLLWRAGTGPETKPQVADEARHLFSMVDDAILDEIMRLHACGHRLRLRTWVGGDKDGHPGVGPAQTRASLQLSRDRLLAYLCGLVDSVARDFRLAGAPKALAACSRVSSSLKGLVRVRRGDGGRLAALISELGRLSAAAGRALGAPHPQLEKAGRLLTLFPGLVIAMELREERGLFTLGSPIARMLRAVREIAAGGLFDWYVRGVVVSMTEESEDILAAVSLVSKVLGRPEVPVIPLFELPEVLPQAPAILDEAWKDPGFRRMIRRRNGRFEVMLGYSDTAKRMGSFPSRMAIRDAMAAIGAWGRRRSLKIVFFHGSGGSVGRGGGTIAEQASTWPRGASEIVKMTLQGEMVQRTLATPEILRSQVLQVAAIQETPPSAGRPARFSVQLACLAREAYTEMVGSARLRMLIASATPYARLGSLNIGSRPSRRAGKDASIERLRAIPWVLCWTQTRFLLPVWFGLGTAWRHLRRSTGAAQGLREAMRRDPLLRGFMRLLGFSLAKISPEIWEAYVNRLAPKDVRHLATSLNAEWKDAMALARTAYPGGRLLPDRRWLEESIRYRAPMIHPLNLLQIQVLEKKRLGPAEEALFRETVTGIAAGMLTTG